MNETSRVVVYGWEEKKNQTNTFKCSFGRLMCVCVHVL